MTNPVCQREPWTNPNSVNNKCSYHPADATRQLPLCTVCMAHSTVAFSLAFRTKKATKKATVKETKKLKTSID